MSEKWEADKRMVQVAGEHGNVVCHCFDHYAPIAEHRAIQIAHEHNTHAALVGRLSALLAAVKRGEVLEHHVASADKALAAVKGATSEHR